MDWKTYSRRWIRQAFRGKALKAGAAAGVLGLILVPAGILWKPMATTVHLVPSVIFIVLFVVLISLPPFSSGRTCPTRRP